LGLSGRIPRRVDAATKAGLLGLLDEALDAGWTVRRVCHELELGEVRAHRWVGRRARGRLVDKVPGGSPVHGLLPGEEAEILALFDEWGETDRSHRKLAHRGSYLFAVEARLFTEYGHGDRDRFDVASQPSPAAGRALRRRRVGRKRCAVRLSPIPRRSWVSRT
jgi:hypothetical protein